MKIYKYKDLSEPNSHNLSHTIQTIKNGTVWCSKPSELNDPDEFVFEIDNNPSNLTQILLSRVLEKYGNSLIPPSLSAAIVLEKGNLDKLVTPVINEMVIDKCRSSIGVACFSELKDDAHLWNVYGGRGAGVSIEFDIPDERIGYLYHPVNYVPEKCFHIDILLESALENDKTYEIYRNILLAKSSEKWLKEKEVRFISKEQEINVIVDGRIAEVFLGRNLSYNAIKILESEVSDHCKQNNIKLTRLK